MLSSLSPKSGLNPTQLLKLAAQKRKDHKSFFDDWIIPDSKTRRLRRKWSDAETRRTAADNATRLTKTDRYSKELIAAFREFRLDPANPYSWRTLLELFALAHFERIPRNKGHRREWTDGKYCQLLLDYFKEKSRYPDKPDTFICDRLVKEGAYKKFAVGRKAGRGEHLRRALYRARDERTNSVVKYLVDFHLSKMAKDSSQPAIKTIAQRQLEAKRRAVLDIVTGKHLEHIELAFDLALEKQFYDDLENLRRR